MRNLKEIRKLRERHDPEDYVKEPDPDSEVTDIEPRVKSQKKFVDIHKKASKKDMEDHPVDTKTQFKTDLKKTSPAGNKNTGDINPPKQGVKEDVEHLEEMVSAGNMKLNDGSMVSLSAADAKKVNDVIASLNPENRKKMESEMKKDKKSFNKMLSFVKSQD